ncbi:MAG: SGNH/GDSL hydrolase family protein [Methanobacterium sp.]|nr:SGNH/GDSL hydrolase family protein [Methanobacterium sp.]
MIKKRRVLCFGDSITWGFNPIDQMRMNEEERWTGILANGLSEEYTIIEQGLNGRTTVWDDPVNGPEKNGLKYLIPCLASHKPLDLVVLMLGTNDLKQRFSLSTTEIARGINVLVEVILKSESGPNGMSPEILLLSPPFIRDVTGFDDEFRNSYNKSQKLPGYIEKIAEVHGCYYLDSSKLMVASELDGVHPSVQEHKKLGNALIKEVTSIFG